MDQCEKQWKEEVESQTVWVCVPALPFTVSSLGKLHNLFPSQFSYLSTSEGCCDYNKLIVAWHTVITACYECHYHHNEHSQSVSTAPLT